MGCLKSPFPSIHPLKTGGLFGVFGPSWDDSTLDFDCDCAIGRPLENCTLPEKLTQQVCT